MQYKYNDSLQKEYKYVETWKRRNEEWYKLDPPILSVQNTKITPKQELTTLNSKFVERQISKPIRPISINDAS